MDVKTKKDLSKGQLKMATEGKIEALQNLIFRRHAWLAKPENKFKSTFQAVLTDTLEKEGELELLQVVSGTLV
jgi:hypothetical protein